MRLGHYLALCYWNSLPLSISEQSGSALPAMLLHVLHNSSLLALTHFQQELTGTSLVQLEQQHRNIAGETNITLTHFRRLN